MIDLLSAEQVQNIVDTYADREAVMARIKAVMIEYGISGRALAKELNCDPALVSRRFKVGRPVPNLDSVLETQLAVDRLVKRGRARARGEE